jgi:L1 cell adhesion molecule like protein
LNDSFLFLQLRGKRNVLIFDLGGGTFDVSILTIEDAKYEVKATAGNTHLGGEDFDNRMVDHFVQEFKRKHQKNLTTNKRALSKLRTACERAKRMLSVSTQSSIETDFLFEGIDFYMTITRDKFEELNADLFRSTVKQVEDSLRDAKMDKTQIDDIVLVGGSTRIPIVQTLLQGFFNGKELNKSINRDEAVACGAAVQAAILTGDTSEELQELVILDVNSLSLGIETDGGVMPVIIKRNTAIPTNHTNIYTTVCNNQWNMLFKVYECEPAMTKNKNILETFELIGIPPAPLGVPQIEVTFHIDNNGILNASAVENSTGKQIKMTVTNDNGRLSNEEIERMKEDAEKYSAEDVEQKQRNSSKNALELYCYNMISAIVDEILKDRIFESDESTNLNKCNEIFRRLDDNQLAENEVFDYKHKERDTEPNQIMTKMEKCAGDMPSGTPGGFLGAGDPAPDGGESRHSERLQSDLFGQSNRGEQHEKCLVSGYGKTGVKETGKQSYTAHVRNLAPCRGLSHGCEAKHGTFNWYDLY